MGETFTTSWKRLFEVRLLHHYWLDEGPTVFDAIGDAGKRQARLLAYDRRSFMAVRPTPETARAIAGADCLVKETGQGFVVAAPGDLQLLTDTIWSFVLSVRDAAFRDYTALTIRPQRIHELAMPDGGLFRCRENVPVLSNATGVKKTLNGAQTLFLSRPLQAANSNNMVEAIFTAQNAIRQLTSDNPNATSRELGPSAALPVFMHQGDFPALTPPAGVVGAPAQGVALSYGIPDDSFAIINLQARRPGDNAFSFIDANGAPLSTPPVFELRFKSRSTVRNYFNRSNGSQVSTDAEATAMTVFGNAGAKQKPSQGLVKAEMSGAKVTRLVSEIYV